MKYLLTFLAGGLAGAAVALLFAPMTGEDLRAKIKETLQSRGICCCGAEMDQLVEKIAAEIESSQS